MGGKWLEALKEVSPWLVRIAVLYSPKTVPYAGSLLRSIAAAAPSFAVQPIDTPIMKLRRSSARSTHSHEHRMADWSYCQTPPLWFTASRLSRVPLNTVGAAPGRAGDGAGDGRLARTCRSLPLEALAPDRDGVALAW